MVDLQGSARTGRAQENAKVGLDVELVWRGKGTRPVHDSVRLVRSFLHEPSGAHEGVHGVLHAESPTVEDRALAPNRLILGENAGVLAALAASVRAEGGVRVAYLDPPFGVQAGFEIDLALGGAPRGRTRDLAFDDTWGSSPRDRASDYVAWLHERILLVHELLAEDGTLYLHVDARVSAWASCLLDEVFGRDQRHGWIVWRTGNGAKSRKRWSLQHNDLLVYAKSRAAPFYAEDPLLREPFADASLRTHFRSIDANGRRYRARTVNGREYVYFADEGRMLGSVWTDCPSMCANSPLLAESTGYPTQKPERLLERVLAASSRPGDLVLDACVGSGTTLAVAERLGRRWIGIDMGEHAIATARKRLLGVQAQATSLRRDAPDSAPRRSFEILVAHARDARDDVLAARVARELRVTTLAAPGPFLGERDGALVALLVAPARVIEESQRPIQNENIAALVLEAGRRGARALEVLACELAPDVLPHAVEFARSHGIELALLRVPRPWLEARKERAYARPFGWLEGRIHGTGDQLEVELTALHWAARAQAVEHVALRLRCGERQFVAHAGALSRVERARNGTVRTTVLTRSWLDALDLWAVDARLGVTSGGFRADWLARRTAGERNLPTRSVPLRLPTGAACILALDVFATTLHGRVSRDEH